MRGAALALLLVVANARAAELPSRNTKPAASAKAQTCDIDGQPGFKVPGSDTCLRFSGYISAGVTAGNGRGAASPH